MYAIIANPDKKTVIVRECDPSEIEPPCEAIGSYSMKNWAHHVAGYVARERGYEFVKEENADTHRS